MESPAKGDNRQGVKASQKHIEFQLQREKMYVRELEDKLKLQQAHISKLEQDKAELRREKITLADDEKKKTRLEERCHALQKELVEKQAALNAEQKRVSTAEAEKDQIRRDAHASIAKWCEAEKQWITENESLQRELDEARDILSKLKSEYDELMTTQEDTLNQLHRERERSSRLETASGSSEKKIASLLSRIEALQNDIYTRDETVFKLDEAGTKWQEICHSKDDEIKAMEAHVTKQSDTIEKLQSTISTLNERIEAVKMISIGEKGRMEKVSCDLCESEKQNKLLQLELEAMRRDVEHGSQNVSKQQEIIADLRSKLLASAEQLKEKNAETRKQELTISQLTADMKRLERERVDASYQAASLEKQLQTSRSLLEQEQVTVRCLQEEKALVEAELQQIKMSHEARDETVVIMKSEFEEKIETLFADIKNLETEVDARQQVINNVTRQLGDANRRNEELYEKVLHDSESSVQIHGMLAQLRRERDKLLVDQLIDAESMSRVELVEHRSEEMLSLLFICSSDYCFFWTQCIKDLQRLKETAGILDAEKNATVRSLATLQMNLEEEREVMRMRDENRVKEIEAKNEEVALLKAEGKKHEEDCLVLANAVEVQEELLRDLQNKENLLSERLSDAENRLSEMLNTFQRHFHFSRRATGWLSNELHLLMEFYKYYVSWVSEKTDIVVAELMRIQVDEAKRVGKVLNAVEESRRDAEARCANLELRLDEVMYRSREREKDVALQTEDFLMKISGANNQRDMVIKANDSLLQKLKLLSEQHSALVREGGDKIEKLTSSVNTEKSNFKKAEEKIQKLQETLNYELGRKDEYKRALEKVKTKKEEADRCRAMEKEWAMKAICRANEEVNYWVQSFDRLKLMLDELSTRSGTRVSVVDQATIQKFEDAKNKLVLRDQSVNSAPHQEEISREKRSRTES